jgi:shikimate kinase
MGGDEVTSSAEVRTLRQSDGPLIKKRRSVRECNDGAALERIFLTGFMGVGKTTNGPILAELMGWNFVEVDDIVVRRMGRTVADIFADRGEEGYREVEARVFQDVSETARSAVIACGGGIVCREENRRRLQENGLCILLVADVDTILTRTQGSDRPLLQCAAPRDVVISLMHQRHAHYLECADWVVPTAHYAPPEICRAIDREIQQMKPTRLQSPR